jgi:hypothetical protein
MASQKVRPAALRRFFRTSTYLMYAFAPEKPPGLAGRNFCLAILRVFARVPIITKKTGFRFALIRENLRMHSIRFYLRTIAFDVEP